jgi:hypothetical protein
VEFAAESLATAQPLSKTIRTHRSKWVRNDPAKRAEECHKVLIATIGEKLNIPQLKPLAEIVNSSRYNPRETWILWSIHVQSVSMAYILPVEEGVMPFVGGSGSLLLVQFL